MTFEEQNAEVERLTADLLRDWGSHMNSPTFAARDLGFPEHTKIHEAAREVIARYAARVVVYDRLYGQRDRGLQSVKEMTDADQHRNRLDGSR